MLQFPFIFRIAYVYITVEDSDGNKMFSIKPDRFVLSANGGKLNTQVINKQTNSTLNFNFI